MENVALYVPPDRCRSVANPFVWMSITCVVHAPSSQSGAYLHPSVLLPKPLTPYDDVMWNFMLKVPWRRATDSGASGVVTTTNAGMLAEPNPTARTVYR